MKRHTCLQDDLDELDDVWVRIEPLERLNFPQVVDLLLAAREVTH